MNHQQGTIFLANLNPTRGNEQRGIRPVVIISGNSFNTNGKIFMVCPISSQIKNYFGDIILTPDKENGLTKKSEILIFQIRTISVDRLIKKLGNITKTETNSIIKGLGQLLTH